jgi:hypothetical protein
MPDDPELFSIVPVEGKAPSDAIVTGPMSEVMEYIGGSVARNEKEAQIAQAERDIEQTAREQEETRARTAQMFANGVAHLAARLDQFVAREQARAAQLQREKEAAENARVEALLAALPDPDDPNLYPGIGSNPAPGEHSDDGDFEAINPPVDTEKHNPVVSETAHRTESITGITPPELEETTPPEPGDFSATAPAPSPYRTSGLPVR